MSTPATKAAKAMRHTTETVTRIWRRRLAPSRAACPEAESSGADEPTAEGIAPERSATPSRRAVTPSPRAGGLSTAVRGDRTGRERSSADWQATIGLDATTVWENSG